MFNMKLRAAMFGLGMLESFAMKSHGIGEVKKELEAKSQPPPTGPPPQRPRAFENMTRFTQERDALVNSPPPPPPPPQQPELNDATHLEAVEPVSTNTDSVELEAKELKRIIVTSEEAGIILRRKGWEPDGAAGAQWLSPDDGNTYYFSEACKKIGIAVGHPAFAPLVNLLAGVGGAAALTTGIVYTNEALAEISSTNEAKEILTTFGEGDLGNFFACLIGLAVAAGAATLILLFVNNFVVEGRHQHNMRWFQAWMFVLTFGFSTCFMLGVNFMEQDAASAGNAFANALTFSGEAGTVGEDLTSTAEYFAGVMIYASIVLFVVAVAVYLSFIFKTCAFKIKD